MALDPDKTRKILRKLRKVLKPASHWRSPEKVHDLRTRTRRVECLIHALKLDEKNSVRSLLKTLRRVFKQAGKVRDMDVLIAFTSGLAVDPHDPCLTQLISHLGEKRHNAALKLHSSIAKHADPGRRSLKKCSTSLQNGMAEPDSQQWQSNAAAFALQLSGELAMWPRLTPSNMHAFRLKIKELRYTLELAEGNETAFPRTLAEVTSAIGEWHDWNQLQDIATNALKHSSRCAVLQAIRSTESAKRHDALSLANTLRRKYLGSSTSSHHQRKTSPPLDKSTLAAIARLTGQSSRQKPPSKAAAHSPQPAATPPSTPLNP
jgi:CHAD domain-containing protein